MKTRPERPDPIKGVQLTPPKSAPDNPSLGASSIENLKSLHEATQAKQARGESHRDEDEEAEEAQVPQPILDPAELESLAEMQQMFALTSSQVAIEQNSARIADQKKGWDRMKQLEKRLEPIRLSDLLFKDTVSQKVPITEDYYLEFSTIPSTLELWLAEVSSEYIKRWPEQAKSALSRQYVLQVATLTCGLIKVCDKPMPAMQIMEMVSNSSGEESIKTAIEAGMELLMRKSEPVLQDMMNHHANFTARVRRVMGHAGYVQQETGKS